MTPRRKRARKAIAIREIAAAALSMMLDEAQRTELRERKVPAKSIIALFEPHHVIFFALGGADRWWNFHMMLKQPHRERSAKDTSTIAHVKRVARKEREHKRTMDGYGPTKPVRLSSRGIGENEDVAKYIFDAPTSLEIRPSRSRWPKGRKLQSRAFQRPTNRD